MREIKFRVWNKFEENFVDSDEYAVTFNGIIFKANLDSDTYNNLISNENLKIMQYTGLKDKNGVEIYEGDILNHDGSLGCVSYINSGNCNVLGYVLSSLINNRIFYMFCDEADDYEIIGNIYDNPELLRED